MTPAWLKLIQYQQRQHRLALTFPFLVGALRQPLGARFENEAEAMTALVSLLTSFCAEDLPESVYVHIYTCDVLKQPVATIGSTYYHPSYADWGIRRPEPIRLVIDPPYQPEQLTDISTTAQLLWPIVSRPMLEARFSFNRTTGSYESLDAADRQFIVEALTYDDESEL